MNDLLRKNIQELMRTRTDVQLEEVYVIDQLLTDGRSTGACFKLVFNKDKTTTTIYVFPERRWCSATGECPQEIATTLDRWMDGPV